MPPVSFNRHGFLPDVVRLAVSTSPRFQARAGLESACARHLLAYASAGTN